MRKITYLKIGGIITTCFFLYLGVNSITNAQVRQSGNAFLSNELIKLSQDPSMNPVTLWLDQGAEIWQKECQGCHKELGTLRKAVVEFPKWQNNRIVNLEDQIVQCFTKVGRSDLTLESQDVLALSTYLSDQAKGLTIQLNPPNDSSQRQLWQSELNHGTNLYLLRQGRINLSCTQCHDMNIGKNLRSDVISPAYLTGFPIYRQSWQTVGSIDRRLRACYSGIQASIPPSGHRDLRALELFLKSRSQGMIWEGPSIRR